MDNEEIFDYIIDGDIGFAYIKRNPSEEDINLISNSVKIPFGIIDENKVYSMADTNRLIGYIKNEDVVDKSNKVIGYVYQNRACLNRTDKLLKFTCDYYHSGILIENQTFLCTSEMITEKALVSYMLENYDINIIQNTLEKEYLIVS